MRLASLIFVPLAGLVAIAACSSSDNATTPGNTPVHGTISDAGTDGAVAAFGPFAAPGVPCTDTEAAVYGDPGPVTNDPANRGKILKCAPSTNLSLADVTTALSGTGYKGTAPTSGANVFKVLYQTTRGDTAGTAGYSSAIVYMPTVPRGASIPIVVAGRGSRGQAARCAVSKFDPNPDVKGLNDDAVRLAYSLVGNGFGVIVPDLAGYANYGAAGNPPSVYTGAADEAHSELDGSRALKQLFPSLADKTVLVGHSQGGHLVLSALAESDAYGVEGTLLGVATYSPLWFTERSWGAVLSSAAAAALSVQTTGGGEIPSAVAVLYHYTNAELLDGAGAGVKLFQPQYQATIKQFVDNNCYGEDTPLQTVDYIYKMFDPAFTKSAASAALDSVCASGDDVCTTWRQRYAADRPHITGNAAKVPLLVLYGGADTTIPPDRARCGIDRLKSDNVALTFCYEPTADHHTILDMRSSYVADWIASLALGGAAPAACAQNETAVTTACNATPSNTQD